MQASKANTHLDSSSALIVLFAVYAVASILFIADLGWTAFHQGLNREQIVLLIAVGTLVTATAVVVTASVTRRRARALVLNSLLAVVATILGLTAVEVALRAYAAMFEPGKATGPYEPKTRQSWVIDSRIVPGVTSGLIHVSNNELGLRGPSIELLKEHPNAYRIITIGGSTTRCTLLDDQKEWPHALMEKLNAKQHRRFVFVGNMGVDGYNTLEHLAFLRTYRSPRQADLLTFLIGANELGATLSFRGGPADKQMRERSGLSRRYPLYSNLRVYQVLSALRSGPQGPWPSDILLDWLKSRRDDRMKSPRIPLPDLQIGLQEYRSHIQALAGFCKEHRKRCVFLTQPSLYRRT